MALKNKAELLISLLYAGSESSINRSIEGITRLEKMLFLLEVDQGLLSKATKPDSFNFVPFKMGPWSQDVYDELDFLDSLDLIERTDAGTIQEEDIVHNDELFDSLTLDKYQKNEAALFDKETEKFSLSQEGIFIAKKIWAQLDESEREKIQMLKKKFNRMNLSQFLRYVYKKYPQYASRSEIKDYLGV